MIAIKNVTLIMNRAFSQDLNALECICKIDLTAYRKSLQTGLHEKPTTHRGLRGISQPYRGYPV
jgi:hypothetical protein